MNLGGAYSGLSDAELDAAYEAVWNQLQAATGLDKSPIGQTLAEIQNEILDREKNVWTFTKSLFGGSKFPKFDALQKAAPTGSMFSVPTATQVSQETVSTHAARVGQEIKTAAIGGSVVIALVAGAYILFMLGGRKK